MTTLAVDAIRDMEVGAIEEYPVIAADIIYQHAAVGLVDASGHARPLVAGDRFVGFAELRVDNSAGAAAAKTVRVISQGKIRLPVSGAVITDVGQPVYAADDDAFQFSPVGGSFVGRVDRFVSSGVVVVKFNVNEMADPYSEFTVRETISADKTLAATDTGKLFWVDTDAKIITLPAIATGLDQVLIVNGGAFGAVAVNVSPQSVDMILGANITGADDKDLINTKATARRNDRVLIGGNDADGYFGLYVGTWARQA